MIYHGTNIIPWYVTMHHSTTLCNYGTTIVSMTYTMACYIPYHNILLYTKVWDTIEQLIIDHCCVFQFHGTLMNHIILSLATFATFIKKKRILLEYSS